jgi:hypothetical protein
VKRRDAARERRNRAEMMKIAAHESSEKRSRIARTVFPTHPVCKNAVQSCTTANVARYALAICFTGTSPASDRQVSEFVCR